MSNTDHGLPSQNPVFESWPCHFLDGSPWAEFSSLICKVGSHCIYLPGGIGKMKLDERVVRIAPDTYG